MIPASLGEEEERASEPAKSSKPRRSQRGGCRFHAEAEARAVASVGNVYLDPPNRAAAEPEYLQRVL